MADLWDYQAKDRVEREQAGLTQLMNELAPLLPELWLQIHHDRCDVLAIVSEKLRDFQAAVVFRYHKNPSFSLYTRGNVEGLSVRFPAMPQRKALTRNYSFHFGKGVITRKALPKLVNLINDQFEEIIKEQQFIIDITEARRLSAKNAERELLAAGYQVTVDYPSDEQKQNRSYFMSICRGEGGEAFQIEICPDNKYRHVLGVVALPKLVNFVGCLEQTLRYVSR